MGVWVQCMGPRVSMCVRLCVCVVSVHVCVCVCVVSVVCRCARLFPG